MSSVNGTAAIVGEDRQPLGVRVGTGTDPGADEISLSIERTTTQTLSIFNTSIATRNEADEANGALSIAIDSLQSRRSEAGAVLNRLDFAMQNVAVAQENQEAARSGLEDLDIAQAVTRFSQQQLLIQASISTLSQANNLPQNLVELFP